MAMMRAPVGPDDAGAPDPSLVAALTTGGGRSRAAVFGRLGRAVRSNHKATAGTGILVVFILVPIFPWVIAHDSPTAVAYRRRVGPSLAHLFGTTAYGQDLFAKAVWGARQVLIIAFGAGLASTALAVLIGG